MAVSLRSIINLRADDSGNVYLELECVGKPPQRWHLPAPLAGHFVADARQLLTRGGRAPAGAVSVIPYADVPIVGRYSVLDGLKWTASAGAIAPDSEALHYYMQLTDTADA